MWRRCSLLFCFSAFLLVCSFAFLLLFFSCSLFCFPAFLFCVFPASLLFCFSAFLLLLVLFLQSCVFMIFPTRTNNDKHTQTIPICRVSIQQGLELELTCVSICNKQIPNLTNSHIYGSLLMTNPYSSSFDAFWGVISRFVSADNLSRAKLSTRLSIAGIQYWGDYMTLYGVACQAASGQ